MPEFKLDQESVSRAEKLSSRLIHDLRMVWEEGMPSKMQRELFSEQRYAEQAEGVPIKDVLVNVSKMAMQVAITRRWGDEILCLKLADGELALISMAEFLGGPLWLASDLEDWIEYWERHFPFPFLSQHFWRVMLRRSGQKEERVILTNFREAEGGIERSLNGFLSYRFAGMKKWGEWIQSIGNQFFGSSKKPPRGRGSGSSSPPPPPAVGPSGGLQVQVSCLTPGLRIHVSPAYFISWVFFGSPTTPVTSYVLPGRYVFAGDGPMLPKRTIDHGVFCIPPTYYPSLTRF